MGPRDLEDDEPLLSDAVRTYLRAFTVSLREHDLATYRERKRCLDLMLQESKPWPQTG